MITNDKVLSIRLPAEIHDLLKKKADDKLMTMTAYIKLMIVEYDDVKKELNEFKTNVHHDLKKAQSKEIVAKQTLAAAREELAEISDTKISKKLDAVTLTINEIKSMIKQAMP